MKYSASNIDVKTVRRLAPTSLCSKLAINSYQQRRKPNTISTYDTSDNKDGKKGYHSWINLILTHVKLLWFNFMTPLSNDKLGIQLKKSFL